MPKPGDSESGIASWYGHPYHGRRAANGEIYDMEQLTAAHRTLPFETWVRVENLSNRKQVEVRITDRGPFIEGRIIDLSHAAARSIDLIGPGITKVRVVVIRPPSPAEVARRVPRPVLPPPVAAPQSTPPATEAAPVVLAEQPTVPVAFFAVQVGAFRDRLAAERIRAEMAARYGTARLVERPADGFSLWRVLVGAVETESAAEELAVQIRREGNERSTAFVVRI